MRIEAYGSDDGRIRTAHYSHGEETRFSLAEEIKEGTLVTEFRSNGEVLDQVCVNGRDARTALGEYLKGIGSLEVLSKAGSKYEPIGVNAPCPKCNGEIARELDLKAPRDIAFVPVVPMFVCRSCKSRYYLLGDDYLKRLIHAKVGLFEKDEALEREKDEGLFLKTMHEYVIRIFASKRISRLKIGN